MWRTPVGSLFNVYLFLFFTSVVAYFYERTNTLVLSELCVVNTHLAEATAAKTRFITTISHELRTPLNGIIGIATQLRDLTSASLLPPEAQEPVQLLSDCSHHLIQLVSDVLDFEKIEANKLELSSAPFDITSTVRRAVNVIIASTSKKGVEVQSTIDVHHPWRYGDELRVNQILYNLLSNAVKFTPAGGNVNVTLRDGDGECDTLWCEVTDTGIGIPPEAQTRLFNAYEQVDVDSSRRFAGSGLGLAISKRLTELMNGGIGCRSEPGEGSTFFFHIRLPRATEEDVRCVEQASEERCRARRESCHRVPAALHGVHVLLVEDNTLNVKVMRRIIEAEGCALEVARNGSEAVDMFASACEVQPYSVILMDCHMPEMDGLEATKRIRALEAEQRLKRVPIIALTGSNTEEQKQQCLAAGMDDVVFKPVERDALLSKMYRHTQQAVWQNE